MIDVFIDCEPPTVTAQQKGVRTHYRGLKLGAGGKVRHDIGVNFFKKDAVLEVEQQFIRWFLPHAPALPFTGPLRLEVAFVYPWRQQDAAKRAKGKLPAYVGKTTTPDTDNSLKLLKDTLTGCRYWHDDAQVCAELTRKGWGDRCGIHVRVMDYVPDYTPPLDDEVAL